MSTSGPAIRRPATARLGLVLALCTLAACQAPGAQGPAAPPPVMVEVGSVQRESITDIVELVGQLEAKESVMLNPETEGIIESIEFAEGSAVGQGDLLFHLRDDEQTARLREARAALTVTRHDYERAKTLRSRNILSQAELDRAESNWLQAQAARDLAEVMLQRTAIRAPFDGILGARLVSPGDRVDRDTDLVSIVAVDPLRLVFTLPEIALAVARPGLRVRIAVAPLSGESFAGEVYFIAPSLDPRTRRLLLKAWIPNADGKLRPGLFANIQVELARHQDALTVPETAVAYDTEGPHVWRVSADDHAQRVPVEVGLRQGGRAEIVGGALVENDRIVAAGTHKVFPGATIRAVGDSGAAPTA